MGTTFLPILSYPILSFPSIGGIIRFYTRLLHLTIIACGHKRKYRSGLTAKSGADLLRIKIEDNLTSRETGIRESIKI